MGSMGRFSISIGRRTNLNGREYVQRLIAAAGIKQDYRTSLAQAHN